MYEEKKKKKREEREQSDISLLSIIHNLIFSKVTDRETHSHTPGTHCRASLYVCVCVGVLGAALSGLQDFISENLLCCTENVILLLLRLRIHSCSALKI